MPYNGFWVLTRKNKPSVSFLATELVHPDIDNYIFFAEGYSLTRDETNEKIAKFETFWNTIK